MDALRIVTVGLAPAVLADFRCMGGANPLGGARSLSSLHEICRSSFAGKSSTARPAVHTPARLIVMMGRHQAVPCEAYTGMQWALGFFTERCLYRTNGVPWWQKAACRSCSPCLVPSPAVGYLARVAVLCRMIGCNVPGHCHCRWCLLVFGTQGTATYVLFVRAAYFCPQLRSRIGYYGPVYATFGIADLLVTLCCFFILEFSKCCSSKAKAGKASVVWS